LERIKNFPFLSKTSIMVMNFKLLFFIIVYWFVGHSSFAQFKSVNGDVSYGFDAKDLGFGIGLTYDLNDQFDISGTARYFLAGKDLNVSAINFNAEYALGGDTFSPYALGGLNITRFSAEGMGIKNTQSEVGINLGIGGNYYYDDQFDLFGELKYVFGQASQMMLSLGTKMKF
jgi:hypothetical protein